MKLVTTALGEAASDFLVQTFPPELAVLGGFVAFAVALVLQFRTRRYRPGFYWTAALMVAVFGTMAADVLHVGLGVPYAISTAGFAIALAGVFAVWWAVERDLSVHDITTTRREVFYWLTIVTTFALGTALGDFTATGLQLGYLGSALGFAVAFAVPGVLFAVTRRAPVVLFWTAYVLTRPLGASVADWLGADHAASGLGLGHGPVSAVLLVVFVALVVVIATGGGEGVSGRRGSP